MQDSTEVRDAHIVQIPKNPNEDGRDLIIGDIHGSATAFQAVLDTVGAHDRLFLVGDLLDRGEDSQAIIAKIQEKNKDKIPPLVYAVRGNHEDYFLFVYEQLTLLESATELYSAVDDQFETEQMLLDFLVNGGKWVFSEPTLKELEDVWSKYTKKKYNTRAAVEAIRTILSAKNVTLVDGLKEIYNYINTLPYVRLVGKEDDADSFIICHADMRLSDSELWKSCTDRKVLHWKEIQAITETRTENFTAADSRRGTHSARVYCGHNAIQNDSQIESLIQIERNQVNLDITACQSNAFLVVDHTKSSAEIIRSDIVSKNPKMEAHYNNLLGKVAQYISKYLPIGRRKTLVEVSYCMQKDELNSAEKIDAWLIKQCDTSKDILSQKKQYIMVLNSIIPSLEDKERKTMADYLLIQKNHLLQRERHCLRSSRFSNETRSMHQVMWSLLAEPNETTENFKQKIKEGRPSRHENEEYRHKSLK